MAKVDPAKYVDFVNQVTSQESKDGVAFVNRLRDLRVMTVRFIVF